MELQQLNQRHLKCLLDHICLDSELTFCEGAVPPKHVLIRSYEQLQNSKAEIWSLPYMMSVGNNVVGSVASKMNLKMVKLKLETMFRLINKVEDLQNWQSINFVS
nr:hypothetical protein [Vibrio cholerae]